MGTADTLRDDIETLLRKASELDEKAKKSRLMCSDYRKMAEKYRKDAKRLERLLNQLLRD